MTTFDVCVYYEYSMLNINAKAGCISPCICHLSLLLLAAASKVWAITASS